MDVKIQFIKTTKGENESKRITNYLSIDIKRALDLIDNKSSVKELMQRAAPSLRESLSDMLQELLDGGFIQNKDKVCNVVKCAYPRMPVENKIVQIPTFEDLDDRQEPASNLLVSVRRALAIEEDDTEQREAISRTEIEAAQENAEAARLKVEQEVKRIGIEFEVAQARARMETEAKTHADASHLKAEQEALKIRLELEAVQAKLQVEAKIKASAEVETAHLKRKQEAIRVKAEHLAALAKEKTEAEVRAESAARTKVEQGAATIRADQEVTPVVAKVKMEASVKAQATRIPEVKLVQSVAVTRREAWPWAKMTGGLFVLLCLAAVFVPYVWPMQGYITLIEQKLSAQLQQPVRVGHLRVRILPQPKLELEDVSIGGSQELKASSVVLNFDFSVLLSEIKAIHSLEINDLIIRAVSFDKALQWLQAAGADTYYPVARIVLQRAHVSDDELSLPPVNGVVNLDGQRRFVKAVLMSEDGKLSMELQPQESSWQIVLAIKEGYVPLLPNIFFNELTIKCELGTGEIICHEIDGRLYGGLLTGSAQMTWLKGWKMQGRVNAKAMELHHMLPQLEVTGVMNGDANFIMRGESFPHLAKKPHLDGEYLVKNGLINKIDLVETVRMPNSKGASSGRTHFDELSGVLQVDNNKQHLRQIKISAGVMSANGYVDVAADKQLSGRLNVVLKIGADLGSVPLVLSGTLPEPVWSTRH
ncbi:hypothetical protein [Candidatus Nitrotoga sp. M5]|uniref:hypothetical protein n=1 Tax=Candidatus Nitrotoga sp. M5 TaxID=2890409 RepID=UPI001EF49743|nr:hypothetical protein [Candidatus Nitrotoga sp. M5]CAH1387818.1 AsmA-like C-terminal region [Candidatus Nitrotoga sp. M5]